MPRFTRGSSIEIEFIGGPMDGETKMIKPDEGGFLPASLTLPHFQGAAPMVQVRYEMDIKTPTTRDGGPRRYVYAR